MTDESIETMLATENSYIEDGGFTARVLGALPPARNAGRLRATVLLVATAVACIVFLILGRGGESLLATLTPLTDVVRGVPVNPAGAITAGALVVMLVWICAATATAE
jgi:hypothetical protein